MPMPWSYRHATKDWLAILADLRDRTGLVSDNQAYTVLDGVLRAFRARLTPEQAIAFSQALPAVPRAILFQDWTPAPPLPFASRADLTAEVKALRKDHNWAPDNAMEAVAFALRRHTDPRDFERALAQMPAGARDFWHTEASAAELERPVV